MQNKSEEKKQPNLWDAIYSILPKAKLALIIIPEEVSKMFSLIPFWKADSYGLFRRTVFCLLYVVITAKVISYAISWVKIDNNFWVYPTSYVFQVIHSFLLWVSPDSFLSLIILSFFLALNGNPKIKKIKDMTRIKDLIQEVRKDYECIVSNREKQSLVSENIVKYKEKYQGVNTLDSTTIKANPIIMENRALDFNLQSQYDAINASIALINMNIASNIHEIEAIISKYASPFPLHAIQLHDSSQVFIYMHNTAFVVELLLQDEDANADESRYDYIRNVSPS